MEQKTSHGCEASSATNTAAQQGRENPFINAENCKLKKEKPHPAHQLLLFGLALKLSVS